MPHARCEGFEDMLARMAERTAKREAGDIPVTDAQIDAHAHVRRGATRTAELRAMVDAVAYGAGVCASRHIPLPEFNDQGTSDGSSASYYELPEGATQLQDLISHRNLNAQDGEIFRAIYRKGLCSHSSLLREAKKVLFYAQAEVARLEKLK